MVAQGAARLAFFLPYPWLVFGNSVLVSTSMLLRSNDNVNEKAEKSEKANPKKKGAPRFADGTRQPFSMYDIFVHEYFIY